MWLLKKDEGYSNVKIALYADTRSYLVRRKFADDFCPIASNTFAFLSVSSISSMYRREKSLPPPPFLSSSNCVLEIRLLFARVCDTDAGRKERELDGRGKERGEKGRRRDAESRRKSYHGRAV